MKSIFVLEIHRLSFVPDVSLFSCNAFEVKNYIYIFKFRYCCVCVCVCVCVYSTAQSCPTCCDPMESSPPGSSVLEFSRQGYWSMLPFPTPRCLPNPAIETTSLVSPALAGGFFTTSANHLGSLKIALSCPFILHMRFLISRQFD